MTQQSIYSIVQEIVAQYLSIDPKRVIPSAHFIDDLGADSLDVVELVMAIEDRFEIEIDDIVAAEITTVQNVLDYLDYEINGFG